MRVNCTVSALPTRRSSDPVARGEEQTDSDVDILVDLDWQRPIGIFEYARLKIYINELLNCAGDVVNRRTLKPLLRESILRDCINAF